MQVQTNTLKKTLKEVAHNHDSKSWQIRASLASRNKSPQDFLSVKTLPSVIPGPLLHTPHSDCSWQVMAPERETQNAGVALLCPQGSSTPGGVKAALGEANLSTLKEQGSYRHQAPGYRTRLGGAWEGNNLEPSFLVTFYPV